VALICQAQLMTQAGLGQVIAPLHIIGSSFNTTIGGELSWYAAANSLTVGTFILIAGRWGDIFGHRNMSIIGFLWFSLWSLLAGVSVYSTQIFFDVCRAFQGIGPAILLSNGIAILGRTYPPGRRKDMIFSIFGATAPSVFVLGALFSSLFAQLSWWPWGFWTMSLVCFCFAGFGVILIPRDASHIRSPKTLDQFDVGGTITGVSGLVLINFAWNQGPVVGWTTPYTYIWLIVGFLFMAAFFWIESRASKPLLPLGKLSKDAGFVLACTTVGWSSFDIWVFYTWQFLEISRGHTPLSSVAQSAPAAISGLCAAVTTGYLLSRISPGFIMLFAMTAFTVGLILIATEPVNQIYWAQTFVSMIVMPWRMVSPYPSGISDCWLIWYGTCLFLLQQSSSVTSYLRRNKEWRHPWSARWSITRYRLALD
jgi:MFS family permease